MVIVAFITYSFDTKNIGANIIVNTISNKLFKQVFILML